MAFQRERIGPYLRWGMTGGIVGAVITFIMSLFRSPGWPGNVTWSSEMGWMSLTGFGYGAAAGAAIALFVHIADRTSDDVQNRIKAENKDPKIVLKMYMDVESGEEGSAYQAIALLVNYMDPMITKNMLEMLDNRLDKRDIFTTDRLAIVRHAVLCVTKTNNQSMIEQLRPYASDMKSEIGVQVRRLNLSARDEFTLK